MQEVGAQRDAEEVNEHGVRLAGLRCANACNLPSTAESAQGADFRQLVNKIEDKSVADVEVGTGSLTPETRGILRQPRLSGNNG